MHSYPPYPPRQEGQPTVEREHDLRRHEARAAGRLAATVKEAGFPVRLVMELGCVFVFVPEEAIDAVPGNVWAEAVSHGVQVCS